MKSNSPVFFAFEEFHKFVTERLPPIFITIFQLFPNFGNSGEKSSIIKIGLIMCGLPFTQRCGEKGVAKRQWIPTRKLPPRNSYFTSYREPFYGIASTRRGLFVFVSGFRRGAGLTITVGSTILLCGNGKAQGCFRPIMPLTKPASPVAW